MALANNRTASQIRARVVEDRLADQSILFNVEVEGDAGERITLAAEGRANAERLAAELNRVAWIQVAA